MLMQSSGKKTFEGDPNLPSLPLPDLQHTLERYLDSLKPFTTPEEYQNTVRIVEAFKNGVGRELNEKLKKKASSEKNWVEKWWENYAYLTSRLPLLPFSSMVGFGPRLPGCSFGMEEDQIRCAAVFCHYMVLYWTVLRRQEFPPTETRDGKTLFSMSQFRRIFSTVRRPGETIDRLEEHFRTCDEGDCPKNVIIMCRGRIFTVDGVDENETPIALQEWEERFREILEKCRNEGEGQKIGLLTCDSRTKWYKYRERLAQLSKKNRDNLDIIEKSLFVMILDEDSPGSLDSSANHVMTGDYTNRWIDKSMELIVYKNGYYGSICDHTACDGIASLTSLNYVLIAGKKMKLGSGGEKREALAPSEEIIFDLDEKVKNKIIKLSQEIHNNKKAVIFRMNFEDYGKVEIQKMNINPDTFVQMALQLAYYRLHNKPAPCYETATTRAYYNGRTETVRSCTVECIEWVKSMLDDKSTNAEKVELLKKAVNRHDKLMSEARDNAGCDRHLFGLYCIALEEGIPIPELYNDPSYFKSGGGGNFVLSTSCTGYTPVSGGVAPMCLDGYGVFYNFMPDWIHFIISTDIRSKETSYLRFFESIKESLNEMRFVLLHRNQSKL